MANLDLNKILEEIKKATSESEVRGITTDGKEVFSRDEKDLLTSSRIKSADDAKKVAELLAKIKVAKEKKEKNDDLLDKLEEERDAENYRGSMSYRVLNTKNLVRNAIDFLTFLSTGIPEKPEDRKKKIEQLQKEIGEKRAEISKNNAGLIPLESKLAAAIEDETEAKKALARRESLFTLISNDATTNFSIAYQGTPQAIDKIYVNNVKDYTGPALSSGSATSVKESVQDVLLRADNFLKAIRKDTTGANSGKSFIYKASPVDYFSGRVYQSKQSLVTIPNNIGYSFLEALRELGSSKLKELVVASGATGTTKSRLDKTADDIVRCIDLYEEISQTKGVNMRNIKDWSGKYDRFQRSLLTKERTQFPYVPAVDWEALFEFMTTVFPVDLTGYFVGKELDLLPKPYLDVSTDPNYVKQPSGGKGWQDKVWIKGYSLMPTSGKNIGWFVSQSGTDPKLKDELRTAGTVPADWNFKSIVRLWYNAFSGFVNFQTAKWDDLTKTSVQEELDNFQCELRYCLTMRELLLELGFSSQINDFDDYLLEIAERAEKKNFQIDRARLLTGDSVSKTLQRIKSGEVKKEEVSSTVLLEKIAKGEVWNLDYSQGRGQVLMNLITNSNSEVSLYGARVAALTKQMGEIEEKNAGIVFEINRKKREIEDLKNVDDFDETPLPGKKTKFKEIYDKKGSQGNKWLLSDIKIMKDEFLPKIKKLMNNDADYKSEGFEAQELELKNLWGEISPIFGNIQIYWESPFQNNARDGLISDAIRLLLKSKDDEKTGKEELEKISGYYQELSDKIILTDKEQDIKKKIDEAIADPSKFKDAPVSDLDEAKLKAVFDFDVDAALLTKWKKVDGKDLTEAKVKSFVTDNYAPGKSKFNDLMSHLKEKGDVDGKKDYDITDDTKKKASWEEFIKKGSEKVIKTIVAHENDNILEKTDANKTERDKKIKEMREDSSAGYDKDDLTKNVFKKERYGDPTEGKEDDVTTEQLLNYLYDKKIDNIQKGEAWDKIKDEKDNGNGSEKNESWWKFGDGNWRPFVTYGLISFFVIGGACMAIFWDKVSAWWNGPAEEEGKIGEDEKESENE